MAYTGTSSATKDQLVQVNALTTGSAVLCTDATLTLTQAEHANRIVAISRAAGVTVTLPAATGTGDIYRIVIATTATSNANIVKVANATDVMNGSMALQQDVDSAGTLKLWAAADSDDTMTFAGAATTGGTVGAFIQCIDYKSGFWSCQVWSKSGGGAEATPFSATVS